MKEVAPSNVHVTSGPVGDALAAEVGRHTRSLPFLLLGRAAPGHGPAPGSDVRTKGGPKGPPLRPKLTKNS